MSDNPLDPVSDDPTTEGPADGGADTSSQDGGADGGAGTEGPADGGAERAATTAAPTAAPTPRALLTAEPTRAPRRRRRRWGRSGPDLLDLMTAGTTSRVSTRQRGRSALERLRPVRRRRVRPRPLGAHAGGHSSSRPARRAARPLRRGRRRRARLASRSPGALPPGRAERRTLGDREFTQGGGVGASVADQVSDDKLLGHFADGATIVLQGLHRTWGPLIDFTQQLGEELGHPVQANAYVTPSQSTGFSDHYDVHDVFVLQMAARSVGASGRPCTRHPAGRAVDRPPGRGRGGRPAAPDLEFTLRPGDVLYLPRGWIHSAPPSAASAPT